MQAPSRTQSGSNLVRWILVVSLGCSLGLLLVYAVVNGRQYSSRRHGLQVIRQEVVAPHRQFEMSEDLVEKELIMVIESQLSAFRKDDYPAAYNFAASSLRAEVPLPEFERMVKRIYPVIAQSDSARFGVILDNGELALVNVTIAGPTGRSLHYQYAMQRERFGWKIAGVTEVKRTGMVL